MMATLRLRSAAAAQRASTKGVLPVPPTVMLPTTNTGTGGVKCLARKASKRLRDTRATNQLSGRKKVNRLLSPYQASSTHCVNACFTLRSLFFKAHLMKLIVHTFLSNKFFVAALLNHSPLIRSEEHTSELQ